MAKEFEQLYGESLPIVYGYFLNRCGGNRQLAEDLTQETFLSAMRSFKTQSIEAPIPWIMSIARRRLVDHFRRQHRTARKRRRLEASLTAQTVEIQVADPELVLALRKLPPLQQACLVLRYVDDLPVRDVAALVGKSVRATESLLSRGRASLAKIYGGAS